MTSLPIFLRPRVDSVEVDLTQRIKLILSTTAAVNGEFERGPIDKPHFNNGPLENFLAKYGEKANPQKYGFAHDTVTSFRRASSNTLINRVVGAGALHAGLSVIKETNRLIGLPVIAGSAGGYTAEDLHDIILLKFAGDLITANSFTMSVTDGITVVPTTPVVFATSHNNTMNNIAAAIQAAMNTGFSATDGSATVYSELSGNNRIILIRPPRNLSLSFFGAAVTLGATQTTASIVTDAKLVDLLAENPGDWGNDYGYKFTNFDPGTRQRVRLTFSQALVALNEFNISINGTPITPVTYATSSDATMAAIAAAIQASPDVVSATVESVAGSISNDRSILVVAQVPGPDKIALTGALVTLGASQAIVVTTEVLKGVEPDHTFTIEIFNRSNVTKPVERFKVSFREQTDSLGFPQNIDYVVNKSSKRSINIRAAQTAVTKVSGFSLFDATGALPTVPTNVLFFTGGDDGVAVTSADIRAGWNKMADRTYYPTNLLLNAGYSSIAVMQTMVELARARSDCLAILDCPFDKLLAEDYRRFRLEEMNIDDSNGAIYGPYVEIEDEKTGARRLIPPSGAIGAVYADNDKLTKQLGSPFGLNRGKVRFITGLSHYYTEGEQELLHPNQCNFIIDKPGVGPVVMSERTLQYKESVLQAVHARRIVNMIKVGLADSLEYIIGDNNTKGTRYRALSLGDTLLKPIKTGGGLYYYAQRCNEINNTDDVIDAEILAYDVYVQVVRVIRGVALRTILLRTGVKMEEVDNVSGF